MKLNLSVCKFFDQVYQVTNKKHTPFLLIPCVCDTIAAIVSPEKLLGSLFRTANAKLSFTAVNSPDEGTIPLAKLSTVLTNLL